MTEKPADRVLKFLMACLFALTLFLLLAPWIALVWAPPGRCAAWLLIGYWVLVAEKVWCMYFRMRQRHAAEVKKDWTAATVGYAYAAVFYMVLAHLVFQPVYKFQPPVLAIPAAAVYLGCILLRYRALQELRHQWAVHVVDRSIADRKLIRTGPYGHIRHPLYLGAIGEILALPLMFGSFPAWVVAVLAFVPLEVQRAYFEERQLREIFPDEYSNYRRQVWAFFPLPFGKKR